LNTPSPAGLLKKMKLLALLLASASLFPLAANAGNMFGPAPFRNGSPLVSGVDGSYQATARAENVTGVFRFAYSGGSQTADTRKNSWVFFVNGRIQRGSVDANINGSSVVGVLDSTAVLASTNASGGTSLPLIFSSGGSSSSAGTFSGKLNLNDSAGAFNGSGTLLPSPPSTNELTIVAEAAIFNTAGDIVGTTVQSTTITNTNAGGMIPPVFYKFRGVRTSTSSSSTAATTPTAN
jgi:hypothetical protein